MRRRLRLPINWRPRCRKIRWSARSAQGLLHGENAEEAFAEARRAVELDAMCAQAQAILGYAAWRTERIALAEESFAAAVRLSGREPFFLAEIAWFLANERGPKAAENAARDAIDADDSSATAWAALGLAQFRLHRRAEAEASLGRALALDPQDMYAQSAMIATPSTTKAATTKPRRWPINWPSAGAEGLVDAVREEAERRSWPRCSSSGISTPTPRP